MIFHFLFRVYKYFLTKTQLPVRRLFLSPNYITGVWSYKYRIAKSCQDVVIICNLL
nr:hypothetical protein Iba_chr03aCG14950 [Ipomoea batatas]